MIAGFIFWLHMHVPTCLHPHVNTHTQTFHALFSRECIHESLRMRGMLMCLCTDVSDIWRTLPFIGWKVVWGSDSHLSISKAPGPLCPWALSLFRSAQWTSGWCHIQVAIRKLLLTIFFKQSILWMVGSVFLNDSRVCHGGLCDNFPHKHFMCCFFSLIHHHHNF